jgi:Fe-S cluster assembly protein SufD
MTPSKKPEPEAMSALLERLAPESDLPKDGFSALRKQAQKVLMQHGFPHRKTENWKYTPLTVLEQRAFASGSASGGPPDAPELPFDAAIVQMHNGEIDPSATKLPRGASLTGLVADDVALGALTADGPNDAFAWLNLARMEQGWKLVVDESVQRPIVLVSTVDDDFEGAVHPRLHVDMQPGSELTLIALQSGGGAGLHNAVFDIRMAERARLLHVIDRSGGDTAWIEHSTVRVGAGADYRAFVSDAGGALTRQDLRVSLDAPNARGAIHGVATLNDRSLVDYHTAIEHRVGPSQSAENFRMLADDRATGVFNGRILIVPGADDSHSEMNTGNLLLSENARINTKPELEIHAEDVTASHGATIGQLDDDARFYLRSRGLSDAEAMTLLKYGFAAAAFDDLEPGPLADWLLERLKSRA